LNSLKNILARGGIEFLAVMLGISGSLWIDDSSINRNDRTEEFEAYSRLSNALEQDISNIEKALIENNEMVGILKKMIENIDSISKDSLSAYIDSTQGYTSMNPQYSDYEALKSTGRLYKISDFDLLQKIIDLYDNKYDAISRLEVEDKRAVFMQDEFFINNYAMKPSSKWTTLKNINEDFERIKQDLVYMNYLVFMYKIKIEINKSWASLIDDIKNVKTGIDFQIANRSQ
jgi:hypothetical protein